LDRRFKGLLKLGRIFISAGTLFIAGLVMATSYAVEFTRNRWIGLVGAGLLSLGIFAAVIALIAYVYFQQRLSSAEILSKEGG